MKAASVKSWYLVHKWTSLIGTVFLLMLCLTGLPLIFYHEIDHALGYSVDPPELPETTARASLDAIVDDARARRPQDVVQYAARDADEPHLWFIGLGETADARELSAYYSYDARTGAFLHAYPLRQGVMNFLFRLHYDLFAGVPGSLFLGAMGLCLVASIVSGVVLYGPFMRKLGFGAVRRDRSPRTKWLDLHNLLGVVTLAWLLVVGVTGVINTLAIPIFGYWQATELAAMTAPYRDRPPLAGPVSADRALAAAEAAAPGMELSFLAFPGNDFAGPQHFVAYMRGVTPWTSKLLEPMLIDARTGVVADTRKLPWYAIALLVSQPLHFGDYGGMPLKILWALLDVLAIVVLGSGVYLWLKRRNVPFEAQFVALREDDGEAVPAAARRGSA